VDGGGADLCDAYAAKYAIVLGTVKSCTPGAANQCAHLVPTSISVCPTGCNAYVNDATELEALQALWDDAGCAHAKPIACPAIACLPSVGATCTVGDGGGGFCSTSYEGFTTN
jgi:hypothetical protein